MLWKKLSFLADRVSEYQLIHFVLSTIDANKSWMMDEAVCQGQSLMQVGIYLTQSIFLHGQLYVAVSRVTSRNGLKILLTDKNGYWIDTTTNVEYKEVFRMYEHWTSFYKGFINVIFVKFVGYVYYVWYCIFNYF